MERRDWINIGDELPKRGALCIVFFPVGEHLVTGKTIGPIAIAYHLKEEGWIYADAPIKLRFKPYYWRPLGIEGLL